MNQLNTSAELHVSSEEVVAQLDHVLAADRFRKAPSLAHLLRYLVTAMVNSHADHLKETVIGIEVFGRRPDFDCRIDNIVRVQAHRLRKSLEAYYADEGSADRIRFNIPKGSYIPHWRHVDEPHISHGETAPIATASVVDYPDLTVPLTVIPETELLAQTRAAPAFSPQAKRSKWALIGTFLAGLCCAGLLLALPSVRKAVDSLTRTGNQQANLREGALREIWQPFLQPGVATIAAFTNPTFLRNESGIFLAYKGPLSAPTGAIIDISPNDPNLNQELIRKVGSRFFFSDSWTGTGEVLAVHKLTRAFADADFDVQVRRSRSLTYSDLPNANLIFIGAPWGNPIVDKLRAADTSLLCCEDGRLQNLSPRPGEQTVYQQTRESNTGELSSSYALFSVLPGIAANRKTAISAGLSTHSTWSGIDYVTSKAGADEIVRRLREQNGGKMPQYFQVVIRTEIIDGEVSGSSLELVRIVKAAGARRN